ncbi:BlaI/MecI/CopY family transcriptional regulator [Chiayiivirga flava]|uniref:Putative transcriptional regulator n=1 Tax=Chiayiivirga flava TaxID=659595 RepID=A0A7W8D3V6_9GAMM|nr:BlaI/MecI/CopY family transcriptional regulator [Chiayiivirga flava]MBB5207461.1 putative transcriptional regulator [Chiayiivirga flava]
MDDADPDVALSDLQLDVMRVLWRADASVSDVVAALAGRRDLAHTTVATVLTRLARRGVVAAHRDGRQLLYRACVTESQVRRSMVGSLIQRLFRGDPTALLAHLVDERDVARDELARVQRLLDAPPQTPSSRRRSRGT